MVTSSTQSSRGFSLERAVMLPWIWLKRSRGWRRRGLLALYALIALAAFLCGWRMVCLSGLPDVGDPFDSRAFASYHVPDEQNAFTLYRQAADRLAGIYPVQDNYLRQSSIQVDWDNLDPRVRRWFDANRDVLTVWRRGTERSRALAENLTEISLFDDPPGGGDRLQTLSELAFIEAGRHVAQGDMAGAWEWYRAELRFVRHLETYGRFRARLLANELDELIRHELAFWARDRRTDPELVRTALRELSAHSRSVPPASESIKVEYLAVMHALDDPVELLADADRRSGESNSFRELQRWYQVAWFFKREPERAKRIARLVFANRLAQADKPQAQRPKLADDDPNARISNWVLYEADPDAPFAARGLPPKEIYRWSQSSTLALHAIPMFMYFEPRPEAVARSRAATTVRIAEELYEREQGKPPDSATALVGRYLDALPEAYRENKDADENGTAVHD